MKTKELRTLEFQRWTMVFQMVDVYGTKTQIDPGVETGDNGRSWISGDGWWIPIISQQVGLRIR